MSRLHSFKTYKKKSKPITVSFFVIYEENSFELMVVKCIFIHFYFRFYLNMKYNIYPLIIENGMGCQIFSSH